jgi:hypothetical protein
MVVVLRPPRGRGISTLGLRGAGQCTCFSKEPADYRNRAASKEGWEPRSICAVFATPVFRDVSTHRQLV